MGSPAQPTPEQYAQFEAAGQLHLLYSPRWENPAGRAALHLNFPLPLHGVSLILITW